MRGQLIPESLIAVALCAALSLTAEEDRKVIEFPKGEAKPVPDDVMKRVYEEAKTPFKYGIVIKADAGKKVDCPSVFRHGGKWYMTSRYNVVGNQGRTIALATSKDLRKGNEAK